MLYVFFNVLCFNTILFVYEELQDSHAEAVLCICLCINKTIVFKEDCFMYILNLKTHFEMVLKLRILMIVKYTAY